VVVPSNARVGPTVPVAISTSQAFLDQVSMAIR